MSTPRSLELDALTIQVIVDNELDPISPSPNPAIAQSGGMQTIALSGPTPPNRAGAVKELRMDHICCSAHGLSLLITGTKDGVSHSVLFDTGPEAHAWARNARRLGVAGEKIAGVEAVVLSHWHRDHSGGMEKALEMIGEARKAVGSELPPVQVDLHPARPMFRGMQPPNFPVVSLEPDPTFEEISAAGGEVHKSDETHTVAGDYFLVSGEIPRVTPYEMGLRFGKRVDDLSEGWKTDEQMADERFLMCNVKGKGLVLFTGCSHAGVVNAARHGVELASGTPLYAVMGGFHLADAGPEMISSTVADLQVLEPKALLAGHCTGWRAKFEIERAMGRGVSVPSFVGSKFEM